MASSGKQKTTWSKLQREAKLRDKRLDKAARKAARMYAQEDTTPAVDPLSESSDPEQETTEPEALGEPEALSAESSV